MEITGETIKYGVIGTLKAVYPDIPVYKEKVIKNMATPCFFVFQMPVHSRPGIYGRSVRSYAFHVRYHPATPSRGDMDRIGTELMSVLGEITLQDGLPIFAGDTGFETHEDEYLVFTVSYRINATRQAEAIPKMDALAENTHVKE
jgi:hypothetical protein